MRKPWLVCRRLRSLARTRGLGTESQYADAQVKTLSFSN